MTSDSTTDGHNVEQRLRDAFADARTTVHESGDLFARVTRSLADSRARHRFRLQIAATVGAFIAVNTAFALTLSDYDNGRFTMPWWVIELITDFVLIALAVGLGPFIKRFGRSYAADVFRANPRTGKSYLVLTDVAYYLIFTSFLLFTVTFVEPSDWDDVGAQLKHETARVGGILLIMGILHAANVVALPLIGRMLTANRQLEEGNSTGSHRRGTPTVAPPLGPGAWIVRIEASGSEAEPAPERDQ